MAHADKCCSLPSLVPKAAWKLCKKNSTAKVKRHANNSTSGSEKKSKKKKFALYPCRIHCIFKELNLYKGVNTIDVPKAKEFFMRGANATWKSHVEAGVEEVAREVAEVDYSKTVTPPPNFESAKNCSLAAKFFLTALKRYLYLNCPNSMMIKDERCSEERKKVDACNPYKSPARIQRQQAESADKSSKKSESKKSK